MQAVETIDRVRASAETVKHDEPRKVGSLSDLDFVRQGDVYLWSLPSVPKGATKLDKPDWQLAPGTSQGSRHVIAAKDRKRVTLYRLAQPNPLQGAVIDAPKGVTIEHPEHGHLKLSPGCYLVTYQREHAEELRRVQD